MYILSLTILSTNIKQERSSIYFTLRREIGERCEEKGRGNEIGTSRGKELGTGCRKRQGTRKVMRKSSQFQDQAIVLY